MSTEQPESATTYLHRLMSDWLSLSDLETLCFRLHFDIHDLPPQGKSDKMRHLIVRFEQLGRLTEMLTALEQMRPDLQAEFTHANELLKQAAEAQPGTAAVIANPFGNKGRIETEADYLIRQPLTRHIFEELAKAVSVSVVGESQSGKSSLLWYLTQVGPEMLGRAAEDFVYFNMELVRHEDDFFENLCEELGLPYLRGMKLGRRLRGRRIILCLDEVERMNYAGFGYDLRSELRGLADGVTAPFTLVIASRSPLNRLFPDSPELTSPLAGICKQENMPFFSLAESKALVAQKLMNTPYHLPTRDIEFAWQQTQGHPGRLQTVLRDCFGRLYPTV